MTSGFTMPADHSYLEGPPRQVPGFSSLHRMTALLLAERVPPQGHVLVLGAGGGLELRALAEAQPGWRFAGVDPDAGMLGLAAEVSRPHSARISLHEGDISAAPAGPFDGAVSLLTFHFIARSKRVETLRNLRRRLAPGAPLVLAHISFPQAEPERSRWISRHVAFSGVPREKVKSAEDAIKTRLSVLDPEEEEVQLRSAGFGGISLFYAGFSFRGWVAYAE